jgi:pyruvate dehydrogenase E1 component beta subunit
MFTAVPGLKCVLPSNAYDAKGLLTQAIRDDDPVIVFEHKMMYTDECEVPDEPYLIPFGQANFTREGDQVTIVAFSRMVNLANQVADKMAQQGISVEVVDPRTTSPLDEDSILDSVEKTGRLVVVDESNPFCSMASEIASLAVCEAYDYLKAPVVKVTAPHTPVPATPALEQAYIPSTTQIETAVNTGLRTALKVPGPMTDGPITAAPRTASAIPPWIKLHAITWKISKSPGFITAVKWNGAVRT